MFGIDPIGTLRHIYRRVNQIFDLVNSDLRLTETGGSVTTTTILTEYNLYVNDAPAGVYKPKRLIVDFTNHVAGDTAVIRLYYRTAAGGALVAKDGEVFVGARPWNRNQVNIELEPNRYGIQVTITRTAGTAKAYPWAVFYEE